MLGTSQPISKGSAELRDLLEVISNADLYSKRMADLLDAEKKAIAAKEALTKAQNLDEALKTAKEAQRKAIDVFDQAQKEADALKGEAKSEALKIVADAKVKATDLIKQGESVKAEAEEIKAQNTALSKELAKERDHLKQDRESARNAKEHHEKILVEMQQKKAKLEALFK